MSILTPYEHQQKVIDRFQGQRIAGLFLEPGCGKTLISINLMRRASAIHGRILKTLIFAPPVVLENWKEEFALCSKVPPERVGYLKSNQTAKKKVEFARNPDHLVKIINYESLRNKDLKQAIKDFGAELTIADESHYLKNPKSQNFKNACEVTRGAYYRYILTGTPYSNSPMDYWAQYYFMDRGQTFGDKFFSFRTRFFYDKNQGMPKDKHFPDFQIQDSMVHDFRTRINATSVRMTLDECVELPDLVEQTVMVEPCKEQVKHYNQVKKDLITWIDQQPDNPLTVKNALTKMLRLNEITNGYMKLEDETIVTFKDNPKLKALMQILENTAPHKVIVFTVYKETYRQISEALQKKKIKYVEIHGGISDKSTQVKKFNDLTNDVRVCICHPRSAGVGINLKSAKYRLFYSRSHSLVDWEQAKARNMRAGSVDVHKKIGHYDLVVKYTLDQDILSALQQKKNISNSLLDIKALLK